MAELAPVRRMHPTSDFGVTEPAVSSPTTAADFYNPRRTASYGKAAESVYQGTGSVASSCLPTTDREDHARTLFPVKPPRSAAMYPPVPISFSSTVASTGMPDMRLVWEAADRVPDMALGMHPGPPASHAHVVASSPPDRPDACRAASAPGRSSVASTHVSGAVFDSENIADAWRNATEQLYEMEQYRDTEGSVRSGRSYARTVSTQPGLPQSLTNHDGQHPSVITLLESAVAHTSPFHQPVPPLHHRPSTRSTTASHGAPPTSTASLPQPARGNLTARTNHTDPHPSPCEMHGQFQASPGSLSHRASMRPDSNSVSLLAPAALQYGRTPSMAGSGYGATPVAGKAPFQQSIYAPSDDESADGVADDSAYNGGPHAGHHHHHHPTPAASAMGAVSATTGDDLNALATFTWTGSDTDGGRSALNAAGAARRALGGGPVATLRRSSAAGHAAPAVSTGVQNVGSSSCWPAARVMAPHHPDAAPSTASPLVGGTVASRALVTSGMQAVSASDSRGSTLAPLLENQDTREARHDTISKLQLFSAILFFAGMNDVAELETIVQENDVDIRDVRDYDGRTPLHLAAAEGSVAATEWLLQQGVDPSAVDRFGRTPLMDALLGGRTPVAQTLLHAGARVLENDALLLASESATFCTLASNVPAALEHINHPDWEICPDELTLGAVLGEGEFGIVHAGRWNGTPVAIKVFKSSANVRREQLASEIAVLLKVHHPNIVQFLGACTRSEPVVVVSEIMDGGSLEDALRLRRRLPLRRALEIALDCARGLNYIHLANPHAMIHRDLKPSNVMLAGSGTAMGKDELLLDTGIAKLTDFGLSKTIASVLPPPPLFATGVRRSGRAGLADFPRIPECSSSGMHGSSGGGDSEGVIPPLRLDGLVPTNGLQPLLGQEHSSGLQAHVPPFMRPEAVSRESAHDTRSSNSYTPAEPPGLVESHSGGQTATGHLNTLSSSLPHASPPEITAAGAHNKRPASGPLRGPSASSDLQKKAFLEQQFQMTGGTGSYTFMAGEIFRHEPYNAKADVYSFAMVLYEMLAGERPFARLDPIVAAMRAATDGLRPEWPQSAPAEYTEQERELLPEVQALVERCWAASPMMRPSCCDIISELEELLMQLRAQRQRYSRIVHDTSSMTRRSSVGCFAMGSRNRGGKRGSVSVPGGGTRGCTAKGGCGRPFSRWHTSPRIQAAGAVGAHDGAARRRDGALPPGNRSPGVGRGSGGGGLSTFESPREREPLLLGGSDEPVGAGLSRSASERAVGTADGSGSLRVLLRRLGGTWKKSRRRLGRDWLGSGDMDGGGFRAIGEKRISNRRSSSGRVIAEWGSDIDDVLWRRWFCLSK
eukprot:jgi/Ulvmu1/9668/UM055_0006.1